jgi:NADH-quinone oxidoreductase subunit A
MTPTAIAAYLALFATVGFLFVLVCLLLGRVLRAHAPTAQKLQTYECGEPAVGPGSVQFDLRFYVVALLFLIFEVDVAFLFPPATVFGKANQMLAHKAAADGSALAPGATTGRGFVEQRQGSPAAEQVVASPSSARTLAFASMVSLLSFFGVLLVAFAYVWSCRDLEWVRAIEPAPTAAENVARSA